MPPEMTRTTAETWSDDDPAVAALALLFTVHRVLSESMDRELRRVCGLSTAQVDVLVTLGAAADGRMRMADIARSVYVSRSGTTQIVDRLVAAGFVGRMVGEADRRTVWATVTDAGHEVLRVTRPVFLAEARRHLGGRIGPGQNVALHAMLSGVLEGGLT